MKIADRLSDDDATAVAAYYALFLPRRSEAADEPCDALHRTVRSRLALATAMGGLAVLMPLGP